MKFAANLSPSRRQQLMFGYLCFVWGTTWLGMKVGIATVPPALFAGTRWTIAGLVLLAIRYARGESIMPPPRLALRLLLVAVLMVSMTSAIQMYGLRYITAGLAAVITSALSPVALLGFSVALGQDRFSPRQLGAIALGVAGVVVLFGPSALAGKLDVWEMLGAAGVIIGCLSYSLGSVLARPVMRSLAPVQVSGLTNLIGGFALLAGALAFDPGSRAAVTHLWAWPAALAWLYLLVPGSLVATTIYFLLVRDWGPTRTGTYAFVSPVIAVVLGCALFGEQVDWGDAAGMLLMLLGAGLALRPAALAKAMPRVNRRRISMRAG
ncbi:MAG TPA: EamA family transporter [Acetobacteraceae bacterium]|nr:EamA family transporter [Acetobacteraceae bacterium]